MNAIAGTANPIAEWIESGQPGLDAVRVGNSRFARYYLTAHPDADGNTEKMFEKLGQFAAAHHAHIVSQYVFGGTELQIDGLPEIARHSGAIDWPVTWIQGDGVSSSYLTGTQAMALAGADVEPVYLDGRVVGGVFEGEHVRCCLLGDVLPVDAKANRMAQTRETFEKLDEALRTIGMDFSNVVRTWLYLDDLLEWYDDFNVARTDFFNKHGVFDRMVPASTGIGVSNPAGTALVADACAMQPLRDSVKIFAVPSPLQCPALDYRSSFSRAVEMQTPRERLLMISGTASIEPGGKTAHVGDIDAQISLTMDVVEAILESRDMTWSDCVRGIAYFRRGEDAPRYEEYCTRKGLPRLPVAVAHADVCRDDLLFEIEIDASVRG